MTKQKIFFSYARADGSAFSLRLATDLKKIGFDVWIDQQDIRAGEEWDLEIEKALVNCDCVLFVETEKSVVSNNVLDEVYYALEQNKKVIPLVYVDSRTPFRLNRLQHIDFTRDYDRGLAQLAKELEGNTPGVTYRYDEGTVRARHDKSFLTRNNRALMIIGFLAVLITAVIWFISNNKSEASRETRGGIVRTEISANVADTPVSNIKDENDSISNHMSPTERKRNDPPKNAAVVSVEVKGRSAKSVAKNNSSILSEIIAGDWRLVDVEPKAQSQRGYLKIEALDENKATIKTYMQFYYPDSKASSYPTIFNAFAGCTSCPVKREMKLKVEDIAVGSRTIKKLQEDQPDGRKAGEVILDANANKSIGGTITLEFPDNNNAIIKVKQPQTSALANEFMLDPFVYTFHFKKT